MDATWSDAGAKVLRPPEMLYPEVRFIPWTLKRGVHQAAEPRSLQVHFAVHSVIRCGDSGIGVGDQATAGLAFVAPHLLTRREDDDLT